MAVIREALIGGNCSGNIQGNRNFSEKWLYFATIGTTPGNVHDAIPVAYGSSYPGYAFAFCNDKSANSLEVVCYNANENSPSGNEAYDGTDMIMYEVNISWGPQDPLTREPNQNPLSIPPIWSFSPENSPKVLYEDFDGNPLVNKAYDYFDPAIVRPQVRGTLSCRVNLALDYVDLPTLVDLANKINSDTIGYWAPKTLKSLPCVMPEPTYNQPFDFRYYEMRFDFSFNPETWEEQIINMGYRELDSSNNQVRIVDKTGQDIQQPAFLDNNGHKMALPITEVVTLPFTLEQSISYGDSFSFLGSDWKNV